MLPFRRTVGPVLALPDRYDLFQGINQPLSRLKSRLSMGRTNRDRDARLANIYAAKAMYDCAMEDWPTCSRFGFQLGELALGHFGKTFVIERSRAAIAGDFPRGAEK